jgi:SpoVK/Ycf46/Vps4 family AAA+-type ATPase
MVKSPCPTPDESTPSDNRPFAIQTFTARYDAIEDRICLNAVDVSGGKQSIYLTRRLMDQIIPVLAKHLEEKTPKGVPADVVQAMTQERLRQARKAEPPAEPRHATSGPRISRGSRPA